MFRLPSFSFLRPGSGTIRATSCTLRSGTGWTSSALRWTRPGPRQITSSTSSTSCRRGSRRTAVRWPGPPTSCWPATSPPASAASPSSSRSSRPTSGATSSRACTTTTSSVSVCVCRDDKEVCYYYMVDFWLCLSLFVYFYDSDDWAGVFGVIRFENGV